MSRFLNQQFCDIVPYTPGEQPQNMEYIKLNTNENPYAPSPQVSKVITTTEVDNLRLYSDPSVKKLITQIANLNNVENENVIVGNGSDEILAFAFLAFGGDKKMTFADITYGFYKVYAKLYGLKTNIIPLTEKLDINTDDYLTSGENIVIANPNAPTGKTISPEQIETVLKAHPNDIVLVDEAYVDFGGISVVPFIKKYDNLLVVQTFSKSRSLAGARLGFGIASKEIIQDLNKIKFSFNPYNINRLSMLAGQESIKDVKYFDQTIKEIISTRDYVSGELTTLGFTVLESSANFIFVKTDKIQGERYYKKLKEKGILVRWFDQDRIKDFVRVTVGSNPQMDVFIQKTKEILKEG